MGRAVPSLREKLAEILRSIEVELLPLLSPGRRAVYQRVSRAWVEEYAALSNYSNPHALVAMLLVSVLDLQAQVEELEERLRRLEGVESGRGELPARG